MPERQEGIVRRYLWLVVLWLSSCYPEPVTPPVDAPDAATCATPAVCACEALAVLGCSEGQHPDCVGSTEAMMASRITWVDVDCIAGAPSKQAVRACAGIGEGGCP